MEAPTARGEAVLAAVAFSSERLLRGEGDSASTLNEVLSHLGAAAGTDRAYLFQNVRDPQGRLWMDLRAEWNAPGIRRIFEHPGDHLHPYAPAFTRLHRPVLARGRCSRSTLVPRRSPSARCWNPRACARSSRCRSSYATNGGATSGSTTAPTNATGPTWRSMPYARSRATWECTSTVELVRAHAGARRRQVSFDGRARTRRSATSTPPTRAPRRSSSALRSRRCSGYRPDGVDRRRRTLAGAAASRRSSACTGRERASQRDGRAVPAGVPHAPP